MPEGEKDTQGAVAGGGPAGGGTPEGPGGAAAQATGGGGGTGPQAGTPRNTVEHWQKEADTWKQRHGAMQDEFDARATKLKEMADYEELKASVAAYQETYGSLDDVPEGGTVAAEPATASTAQSQLSGLEDPQAVWQRTAHEWYRYWEQESDSLTARNNAIRLFEEPGIADLGLGHYKPRNQAPRAGEPNTQRGLTRAEVEKLLAERDAKRTAEQFASARSYDRQVRELTEQLGEDFLGAECEVGGEKMTREEAVEVYCAQKGTTAKAAVMDLFEQHYLDRRIELGAQALLQQQQQAISAGQLPSGPAAFPQAPPPNAELDGQVAMHGTHITMEKPDWAAGVIPADRV